MGKSVKHSHDIIHVLYISYPKSNQSLPRSQRHIFYPTTHTPRGVSKFLHYNFGNLNFILIWKFQVKKARNHFEMTMSLLTYGNYIYCTNYYCVIMKCRDL